MLQRLLTTALLAGLGAGLLFFLVQTALVTPLIRQAETLERQAAAETVNSLATPGHGHDAAHGEAAGETARQLMTLGGDLATGVGFALLLCAAITLRGRQVSPVTGLVWGMAGFAVFAGLPALGTPPLAPGAEGAPVAARQLWWLMTAGCSAAGLALLAFAPGRALRLAGAVFLLLPHLAGAPAAPVVTEPLIPASLATLFTAASLAAAAVFWAALGAFCGFLLRRRTVF